MPRYALSLAYDGHAFSGWWRQTDGSGVANHLDQACNAIGEPSANAVGASRTDAGVHALGQIAHIDCQRSHDAQHLLASLNRHLPTACRCHAIAASDDNFHACHDASGKSYDYILHTQPHDPFKRQYCWQLDREPDLQRLQEAAALCRELTDASPLRRRGDHRQDLQVHIKAIEWQQLDAQTLRCRLTANRFIYRMARSLVGSMVQVGLGSTALADLRTALQANKSTAPTQHQAPAQGLFLQQVHYPRTLDWITGKLS